LAAKQRPEFRVRVGARIKERRLGMGLSQSALARLLPEPPEATTVGRWERGESFPTYANFVGLAKVFGVCEETLISGRNGNG
jgi:transcriptional regulator with XRE-family HTH domain